MSPRAGQLDFDHVGAEPSQKLRAGRPRLHMGHIEYADSIERFRHRFVCSLRKVNLTTKITKELGSCTINIPNFVLFVLL